MHRIVKVVVSQFLFKETGIYYLNSSFNCVMLGILSTDWILQKTAKEENGEMKYFTREKK